GRARTGADVEVSLIHEVWLDTHGALTCGTCRVDRWSGWGIREDTVRDWHVTTGVDADAVSLTVSEGGSYIVRAAATDSDGRRTRTDVRLYVSGAGAGVWRNDDHAITLVPERRTWRPGETARILIQSPWAEAVALVTTEREAVRSVRHVRITSTSDVLSVPITEADVPNVFVSVVLLKGRTDADPASDEDVGAPAYRIGIVELDVATSVKRLQVAIDGGARTYRPRQTANVSVSVASPAGSPERSEVTLWAVDEGLLSLTDFHVPDPVAALYRPRSLNVSTVESRQRLIRRHAMIDDASGRPTHFVAESVDVKADVAILQAASGERSDVVGGQSTELEVRRDFRSVAWWLGSLVTGADGRAETSVTLPDGLTTYRIMAVAADRESRLGAASDRVTVTKPVTITPAFPRFLAEGDRATFDAVVTDVAGPAGRALIAVRSLTPEILSFDRATEAITLAKASAEPVRFDAFARGVGTARVQMTVTLGTETDAFETTIPVVSWRVRETEAAYGQTSGRAIERMAVPAGASTTTGGLTVSLASTALLGLGEGARYVNEYPYDCAEQHASRALVLAFVAALGPRFAGTGIASSQSRKLAEATAMSLSNYQCPNGGFSLWPGRCGSDGHLTAYILDVVRTISALGLKTPDVSRAASYLAGEVRPALPADPYWAAVQTTSRAYMLKVLAESGDQDRGALNRLLDERDHLPVTALSYAADALAAAGDRREAYADVIRRIRNAVRIDGDRAHAEEPDDPMLAWLWESEAQATAVVLDGFLRRGDEAPMVLPLVRGLLERRTNGRWATTHENAAAIRALGAYFRRAEERPARMTATVSVGPTAAGSATLDSSQHTARDVSIPWAALLGALDGAGRADIAIRREGTGPLYYTLRLDADRPQPREPLDRGLQILRTYEPASDATVRPVSFRKGDLVRVHLTLVLHAERRYVALVDPLPAGFEIVDGLLDTTRRRDAAAATTTDVNRDWLAWWRRGGFERIEKHDDRVLAFATRLSAGRHELSYLVRASASGTFQAPGARAEEMYAPEISGRGASSTVVIER
ncbi:MAG TPA: alpha-2-macroglobulin family protein, partial [Thermoleophilia bacterium]|nr:alpha-2-macroglobulin family protein [Thermoleophilia bacterium]